MNKYNTKENKILRGRDVLVMNNLEELSIGLLKHLRGALRRTRALVPLQQ